MSDFPNGCGCLPIPDNMKVGDWGFPMAEDVRKPIPRDEWKDRIDEHKPTVKPFVPAIRSQGRTNECAAFMVTGIAEVLYQQQGDPTLISPAGLYRFVNGGRDLGANVMDAITAASTIGLFTLDDHSLLDWREPLPDDWRNLASLRRFVDWHALRSFDGFFSELLRGNPCGVGVRWGRGGHAIFSVTPKYKTSGRTIVYNCEIANSHGTAYEDKGFGTLSERTITDGIRIYGAGTARTLTVVE